MRAALRQRCAEHATPLRIQRRDTLKAAAAWLALSGLPGAIAQQRGNIIELTGDVLLNGQRLLPDQTVQTGDQIQTGPTASLIFVIGDAAFQVRPDSRLTLARGDALTSVSQLRLAAGAVASVWGPDSRHQLILPGLSADFRDAGLYAEVSEKYERRSYLCNCYGALALSAGENRRVSTSAYHQAFWAASEKRPGDALMPADSRHHTDGELAFLARLISQKPAWQRSGPEGAMGAIDLLD